MPGQPVLLRSKSMVKAAAGKAAQLRSDQDAVAGARWPQGATWWKIVLANATLETRDDWNSTTSPDRTERDLADENDSAR